MTDISQGDDFTQTLRSDSYPAIDPSKANLQGKSIFVCGASQGIGRAIAVSYAKAGASCIAIGARSDLSPTEEAIGEATAALGKSAPKVLKVKIEVTNQKSVENAAQEIEKTFGRLDTLVHNAGVLRDSSPIIESNPETWWNTMEVNIRGPYLVTRSFLPLLLKGGSKQIAYVSSVGAWAVMPGLSSYQPSKLTLTRFAEFVDAEYGHQGVVAFSIHPGNVPGTAILGPDGPPVAIKHRG